MKSAIRFHPQLRILGVPRCVQRDLSHRMLVRFESTTAKPSRPVKERFVPSRPQPRTAPRTGSFRESVPTPTSHAKAAIRRGPPERILIYNGGTGRIMFLGVLRITTIFVFGVSVLIVAPAFFADEFPSYLAPAIVVGGLLPLLFVSYTSAPYVNWIHLALPVFARKSREQAIQYAQNLPPTATLYINTMKFSTIPRRTEVRLGDLVPDKAVLRPVKFRNRNPVLLPWWQGRTLTQFYASENPGTVKATSKFYPEVWEHVFKQIQRNVPGKMKSVASK